ncbi:MAG: tandem-95 repeat protein, partial [Microbacterium sp.]|nr:tandem-95 repeat protein [Microbacterium sp.]
MKSFAWLRARPRAFASVAVIAAGAVALTTLAFVYQGNPTTEVDLNDGSVWVTKQSSLMVGHFNHESRVLDGGLRAASDQYDVLQSGDTVLLHDESGNAITAVDPATVALTSSADLPAGAQVVLGGQTVAVLDPAKGSLWVVPAGGISGFTAASTRPVARLGADAAVTVGGDGTVYAVSVKNRKLVTVPVDAEGVPGAVSTAALDALPATAKASITVVGTTPVVLDSASGTVLDAFGLHEKLKGGESAVLQQPSASADAVTVATTDALLRVPLDGSTPTSRAAGGSGVAAAPVWLNGCAYGAWSGSARYVRDCPGTADDMAMDVPGADARTQLEFRVNRDVVVLNDIVGGSAWMASDSMQQVDNWDDLTPPKGDTEDNDETTTEQTIQNTLPKRSAKNTPPIANDDSYGVRPGRTTILPVLDNDTDADGDVLTVSVPDGDPRVGKLQTINNGSGLQIAVPEDATGAASFRYTVDDGRQGTASATVQLAVHPWNVNGAPKQKRVTALTIESGGVLTYNVLSDWIDPDGDNLFLTSAQAAPGDEAEVSSDGRITYRALSGTLGRKDVKIFVSDGQKVTEGTVRFDVRPQGSTEPVTTADHVIAHVGQPVTVSPLVNDFSSGTQELRLTRVDDVAGATVTPDFASKTFSFVSKSVGTYYVSYLVAAGSASATGIVRVDVVPDSDSDLPPVAVRDVALLPSGGDVLVNVLANDSDPAGGILVVQSVSVPQNSGVSVAVLNHETLRVSDQGTLDQQVTIGYTISNGRHSATGQVIVVPVPAPSTLRPPVANDDHVVVRAGDIVTIPVLDNDVDPNGGRLTVAPKLVPPLVSAKDGEAFVSQNTVRFRATDKPGTVYLTYQAVDATGQKDAGYVTIQVLPVNRATNTAPRPKDITARVLSGSEVRIPIPLDGIDADGDSVDLVGIASAPAKGSVVETGADYLVYRAIGSSTGVDTFSYRVRDRLGKEGTATIRVGIAPAASVNQAPYAVKDSVVMRPGRSVAVPVLANDSDPEGDAIGLVTNGLVLPKVPGLRAKVVGDRVEVTAPDAPVETSLQYTIRDARGAQAVAVLQISVKKDVPLLAPVARDDRVRAQDIKGGSVDVDVLANDEDPDGTVSALTLSVEGSTAQVLPDRKVRVKLDADEQLITYTVTDQDGLTASAFIHVPSVDGLPPTLLSTKPVTVKSGETKKLPLSDYVRVSDGRTPVITEAGKVVAVHGDGAELVQDQSTLVYTSAKNYYGPDAITFEVTDGTGPDDPKGHKATLVLPITVVPPDNVQPTFVDGQMSVAPGEDAIGLDLRPLTTDPDEGDLAGMRYSIAGAVPAGFTAQIDGQTLKVKADAKTPKGAGATIRLRITDGQTAPVEGSVAVRVTASTRPLATANDDIVPEAHQGETISVPVLDNDFNPFPGTPLRGVSAVTETGDGAPPVIQGDKVLVTPAKSFVGRMVVQYRVQDATGDVDREV